MSHRLNGEMPYRWTDSRQRKSWTSKSLESRAAGGSSSARHAGTFSLRQKSAIRSPTARGWKPFHSGSSTGAGCLTGLNSEPVERLEEDNNDNHMVVIAAEAPPSSSRVRTHINSQDVETFFESTHSQGIRGQAYVVKRSHHDPTILVFHTGIFEKNMPSRTAFQTPVMTIEPAGRRSPHSRMLNSSTEPSVLITELCA